MPKKLKDPSFATRAIAGEFLEDIEKMAAAIGCTRATVIRSMLYDWFRAHRGDARLEQLRKSQTMPDYNGRQISPEAFDAAFAFGIEPLTAQRMIDAGVLNPSD